MGFVGVVTYDRDITQEGLIGFDWGRQFQEKRVEEPATSR
jgi:hypothetical protein